MSTTGDLPGLSGDELDADDDAVFDELARRAGAALRRPPPEDGVRAIAARQRRQQARNAAIVGGVAVAALVGALVIVSGRNDPDRLPPVDSSPQMLPATTTVPATTIPSPGSSPVDSSAETTTPAPSTTDVAVIQPAPVTTPELFTEIAPGSRVDLPAAPISGRNGGAAVWTGTEMIVWSGKAYDPVTDTWPSFTDGAAFNLANGTWRVIAPAPIRGREQFPAVWTGTEMIVWGGFFGEDQLPTHDGAAYNPTTDTWRTLPTPLFSIATPLSVGEGANVLRMVWTGTEAVVSGGPVTAAYDPLSDSWRRLADRTVFGYPIWTGDSIVWNDSDALTRYDVAADNWTVVANPYADVVGVPDPDGYMSTFIALPKETGAPTLILDHDLNAIGELPAFPGDPSRFGDTVGASAKWVGEEAIFTIWAGEFPYEPEQRWSLNPTTQTWRQLAPTIPEPLVVAGDVMLAWGEQSHPTVLSLGVAYRSGTSPSDP